MNEGTPKTSTEVRSRERGDQELVEDRETVEELEEPLFDVLEKLKPRILAGEFKVIIGEDASGRIPTLILGEVISRVHERAGKEKPLIRFVAGSTSLHESSTYNDKANALGSHISLIASEAGVHPSQENERILVVTDTISSGISMGFIARALRENNLNADIATVGLNDSSQKEVEEYLGFPIAKGARHTPDIYRRANVSGVVKRPQDLHSMRLEQADEVQYRINAARSVAKEVAKRLGDRLFFGEFAGN